MKNEKHLKYFIREINDKDILHLSASLSFYAATSFIPLSILVLYILSFWGGQAQHNFIHQIIEAAGPHAGEVITGFIKNSLSPSKMGTISSVLGIATLLFASTGIFSELQNSMNKIFEVKNKKIILTWTKQKLISFLLIIFISLLSIASLLVNTSINYILEGDKSYLRLINNSVSFVLFIFIFSLLLKYLPQKKISLKNSLKGGMVIATLYSFGRFLMGLYFTNSSLKTVYGGAWAIFIFLIWLYYSSMIIFVGAIYTKLQESIKA